MRVKKVNCSNIDGIIIYITAEEKLDENIIRQVRELRKKYKEAAVFVSGRNSMERALTAMIRGTDKYEGRVCQAEQR